MPSLRITVTVVACWLAGSVSLSAQQLLLPPKAPILIQLEQQLDAMPAPKAPFHGGIVYKTVGDAQMLELDLYLPYDEAESGELSPVCFFVHGGSWLYGDRRFVRLRQAVVEALRSNGVAIISIDYRKLNEAGFGPMLQDCLDSLKWLTEHAAEFRLDTARVVLNGASSGGHLALMMGFTHSLPDLEIQLIVDEFGPTDLVALSRQPFRRLPIHPLSLFPGEELSQFSPVNHVKGSVPAVHIVHGEQDDLVPLSQSHSLVQALNGTGNSVVLDVVEGGNHGLLNISATERDRLRQTRIDLFLGALGVSPDANE